MLKRCVLFVMAAVMVFSLAACRSDPAVSSSSTDIGGGVVLHQAETAFEEGTAVTAEVLTDGEIFERAQTAVAAEAVLFTVFEITAVKDDAAVQPKGSVKVEFPIPAGYSSHLALYYVSESGAKEALKTTVDSDKKVVSAQLTHFSTYVLVDLGDEPDAPTDPTEPGSPTDPTDPGETHTHAYGEWAYDADSHWKECACGEKDSLEAHGFGDWTVTKEATETAQGSKYRSCAVCGYEETAVIPNTTHIHAFGDWKSNADSHWKECACGEKDSQEAHGFGDWTITKEATETAQGSKYRTCAECGYKNTVAIPVTAHSHTYGAWKSNSTSHWKECGCGEKNSSGAHSFGDWTVTKEATESAQGSKSRSCSVCGYQETQVIPVASHQHTFNRTSAGLKKGTCDVCGAAMPIYNLGEEIYDAPGENLWLVVNDNGSYDWYYEADSKVVYEDWWRGTFWNNYSDYWYPVMEVNVDDGEALHCYVLIFYIEDGELKHIIPSDPDWDGVVPDNVVDPKEIFCSDGELREAYEEVAWYGYVIDSGTTTLGGRTEEYTVTIDMHTPRSKSYWETNRMGPDFITYYETSYTASFRKVENGDPEFKNTVSYNADGDYYTLSAYTERSYQAPDVYDLYYYQNIGLLSTLTSSYSPDYRLYADMTCEKIDSDDAPLLKEIYQGLPYGLDFTLISDDPNVVVTYKFVVDHPDFRNITELYKTVRITHTRYLVRDASSGGYVLTDVRPS